MAETEPPGSVPQLLEKKRRRPALACEQCRRRKVRCDRNLPCNTCVKSKNLICTYTPLQHVGATGGLDIPPTPTTTLGTKCIVQSADRLGAPDSSASGAVPPSDTLFWHPCSVGNFSDSSRRGESTSTPESLSSSSTVNSLVDRVKQLEQQLAEVRGYRDARDKDGSSLWRDTRRGPTLPTCGTLNKTRYFGQSHWVHGANMFFRLVNLVKKVEHEKNSDLYHDLQKCKNLGRAIKAHRTPSLTSVSIGKHMPSRQLADQLIDAYLRTFETVCRVVHIPSFKAEYERYWQDPAAASQSFVVLMQLCLALGTTFYDNRCTLRPSAMQWLFEAQFWLLIPCEKSKMTITGLQILCLLHYAKQTVNVGSDLTWIGAGSLIRTAMHMGLHRDPNHLVKMTVFRAEMRRRIWAVILELALQSSIDSGGPPLISMQDYDTEPPANLDDSQLIEDAESAFPVPKDLDVFTQMSVQLVVFKTFPARLAIAKHVNEFQSDPSYDEILRLNAALTSDYQSMNKQLKAYPRQSDGTKGVSNFQLSYLELMTYRFFLTLHHPLLPRATSNPLYYYSRKICVDTALRIWKLGVIGPTAQLDIPNPNDIDFARLTICAAGGYRSTITQAMMIIGVEITTQVEEERRSNSLSPTAGSAELRAVAAVATDWTKNRIRAGETNVKGHAFGTCMIAQIEALEAGCDDKNVEKAMLERAQRNVNECYDMLKELAGDVAIVELDGADVPGSDIDFGEGIDILEDWEWDDGAMNQGFSSNFNFNGIDMILD